MTMVYRFRAWDITNDCYQTSRRWATKEAIDRVMGQVVGEGVDIDDRLLGGEVDGMTVRSFNPHPSPFRMT